MTNERDKGEKGVGAGGSTAASRREAARAVLADLGQPPLSPPPDMVDRVMADLPDHPDFGPVARFRRFFAPRGFRPLQIASGALAGAAAALVFFFFFQTAPPPMPPAVPFAFFAPRAKQVELATNLHHWAPVVMEGPDASGHWEASLAVNADRLEYVFVVDGRRLAVDPTAEYHRPDGFGRRNSVVEFPGRSSGSQAASVSLSAPVEARPQDPAWSALSREAETTGLTDGRIEALVNRFAGAGYTPQAGRELLRMVGDARREGLQALFLVEKIHEGLLKGVRSAALIDAVKRRKATMSQVHRLLENHRYPADSIQRSDLALAAARALESGLPLETLAGVLAAADPSGPRLVEAVIEMGEELHLSDFEHDPLHQLLTASLQKPLTPLDVERLEAYIRRQLQAGLKSRRILETLPLYSGPTPESRMSVRLRFGEEPFKNNPSPRPLPASGER